MTGSAKAAAWRAKGLWLAPCPFCGSATAPWLGHETELQEPYNGGDRAYDQNYAVVCSVCEVSPVPAPSWETGCGASGGFRRTPEDAARAWNERR